MKQQRLDNVKSCMNCPDRTEGCRAECTDLAVRTIMNALLLPETRAAIKLGEDLRAIKYDDLTRLARKKMHERR